MPPVNKYSLVRSVLASLIVFGSVAWGLGLFLPHRSLWAQEKADPPAAGAYRVSIGLPIDAGVEQDVRRHLERLAEAARSAERRPVVVLDFGGDSETDGDGAETEFERALGLSRFMTSPRLRSLRLVAFLKGPVRGHAILPVLAADQILVTADAELGPASVAEDSTDQLVRGFYQDIAERRQTIPSDAVAALLDPDVPLGVLSNIGGGQRVVGGEALRKAQQEGDAWQVEILSEPGQPTSFSGHRMRQLRWAAHLISGIDEAAEALDVQRLVEPEADGGASGGRGRIADVTGPLSSQKLRRLQSNIADAADRTDVLLVRIDSPGGNLDASLQLAGYLASLRGRVRVVGWVHKQALGDAALLAAACEQLWVAPGARLGGGGAGSSDGEHVQTILPAIADLAERVDRPEALLRGLIQPDLTVFQYTDVRSGRIGYFLPAELAERDDTERWEQGPQVDFSGGLSADQALRLGLASREVADLDAATRILGLDEPPPVLAERRLVHWVERLGAVPWLPQLLLFIGFITLSIEMGAPGVGLAGFVSLLSFALFFWMQFLSGTAEWLELVLFLGGLGCILLELFVLPGVGIFGLGGLAMLVAGIVLVSQTFVIPQNSFQYVQMTRSLLGVFASIAGVIVGGAALRVLLPRTPGLREMVLAPPPAEESLERAHRESLAHWEHLMDQEGKAVTPLVPSGKVRFGDEVVAVVTDGSPVDSGQPVRVIDVQGNRVVVEPIDVDEARTGSPE